MKRTIPPTSFKTALTPGTTPAGELLHPAIADIHTLANFNLRVEGTLEFEEGIGDLVASIAENGFYQDKPLAGYVTKDGEIIVIDGHRRLAAVNRLNAASLDGPVVETLPVIVKPETDSMMDLTIAMIQSASGVPLTEFERGVGCRRLIADGMSKEDIAKRLGSSVKTIENYILVASLPAKGRDLLLDGKVKFTHALKAMRKPETAVDTLTAMVKGAEAKGRKTARQSDAPVSETPTPSPAEASVDAIQAAALDPIVITIAKDADMGTVVRQVAAAIRERVPHDKGDEDLAHVNGTVSVTVTLEAPSFAPKRSRKKAEPVAPIVHTPAEAETVIDLLSDL